MFPTFYVLIGHLHIFVREVAIQILCPIKKLFVFLLLSFNSSLYVLDTIHLSEM